MHIASLFCFTKANKDGKRPQEAPGQLATVSVPFSFIARTMPATVMGSKLCTKSQAGGLIEVTNLNLSQPTNVGVIADTPPTKKYEKKRERKRKRPRDDEVPQASWGIHSKPPNAKRAKLAFMPKKDDVTMAVATAILRPSPWLQRAHHPHLPSPGLHRDFMAAGTYDVHVGCNLSFCETYHVELPPMLVSVNGEPVFSADPSLPSSNLPDDGDELNLRSFCGEAACAPFFDDKTKPLNPYPGDSAFADADDYGYRNYTSLSASYNKTAGASADCDLPEELPCLLDDPHSRINEDDFQLSDVSSTDHDKYW
jgi:hypothetical protein